MEQEFIRIANGRKAVNGMILLEDFYLTVYRGTIALLTGGSVLEMEGIARLLSGQDSFTAGDVFFNGEQMRAGSSATFLSSHVVALADENRLIENMSIIDNFFVCSGRKQPFFAQDRKNCMILKDLFRAFGIGIFPEQRVDSLNVLQQYQLQLLKQYYCGKAAVFLDRRKMSLSNEEFQKLYGLMDQLKKRGMTFIVLDYISSPVWCCIDTLVVVKRAATVLHEDVARLSDGKKQQIMRQLTGQKQSDRTGRISRNTETVLQLCGVGGIWLHDIDLELHSGEIAAIYYEKREPMQELFRIVNGSQNALSGEIYIRGRHSAARTRDERVNEGVSCLETYAAPDALFENMTAWENYCMPKGLKFGALWRNMRYRRYLKRQLNVLTGRELAEDTVWDLKPEDILRIQFQAQLLARPTVLVCVNPFSSVDSTLQKEIESLLGQLADTGTAILLLFRFEDVWRIERYTQYILNGDGTF